MENINSTDIFSNSSPPEFLCLDWDWLFKCKLLKQKDKMCITQQLHVNVGVCVYINTHICKLFLISMGKLEFAAETFAAKTFPWRGDVLKFIQEILLTTSENSLAASILGWFVKDLSGL